MNILIVHQHYLQPGQAGGSRFNEFARMWSDAGHAVTVLAGTVDHATGNTAEKYRGRWVTEEWDGPVRVLRCFVPRTYASSYVGRAWAFLGYAVSATTCGALVGHADVVVATSPPLVTAIPGWILARLRGRPAQLIFEVRDLWPESAVTTGVLAPNSLMTRALYGLEAFAYRTADRINVLTPAFEQDILERGLAPRAKIVFVPNGADVELFKPGLRENASRATLGWGSRTVFAYAGAHGRANDLGQLIDAADRLRDRRDILIATVGDGTERAALVAAAQTRGLTNIVFHGARPKSEMPDVVNACDVGMAILQNNPTFRTVYPNKVFDYMACERPVLLNIDGVARKLVCDAAGAGVYAPAGDASALDAAIRVLADSPERRASLGRAGRQWVLANATRNSLAARYLDVMRSLVESR